VVDARLLQADEHAVARRATRHHLPAPRSVQREHRLRVELLQPVFKETHRVCNLVLEKVFGKWLAVLLEKTRRTRLWRVA
jgi:hypothetical protein